MGRISIESPERLSVEHGSALRTSTANPKLMNRIKLQRDIGDISAEQYVQGHTAASIFGQLPYEDKAKHLRVSVEKGLHKDNINYEE